MIIFFILATLFHLGMLLIITSNCYYCNYTMDAIIEMFTLLRPFLLDSIFNFLINSFQGENFTVYILFNYIWPESFSDTQNNKYLLTLTFKVPASSHNSRMPNHTPLLMHHVWEAYQRYWMPLTLVLMATTLLLFCIMVTLMSIAKQRIQ